MKNLLLLLAIIPVLGFSQNKFLKTDEINNVVVTLTPLVYDPNMDSTITHVEFWQDTTLGVKYEDTIYAVVYSREKKKFSDGAIDWPVAGIGFIGDYRVDNSISVIIKTYHKDGSIKTFKYTEKIKKLFVWKDFEWAMYSPDVYVIYDEEEGIYGQ